MRKYTVVLIAVTSLIWGESTLSNRTIPFVPKLQTGSLSTEKIKAQNLHVVQKAVEGIRESLPQQVDAFTRIIGIDSNGTRLIYTYEIDGGRKDDKSLREDGRKRVASIVRQGICQGSQRFLQADIDITYRYISKMTQHEILKVDVSKEDCNNKQ